MKKKLRIIILFFILLLIINCSSVISANTENEENQEEISEENNQEDISNNQIMDNVYHYKIVADDGFGLMFENGLYSSGLTMLPDTNMYLGVGGGVINNLFTFRNNVGNMIFEFDNFLPTWNVNLNFRLNKWFTYGFGINLFSPEIFIKLSPINANFPMSTISNELYIKPSLSLSFFPYIGLGGNLSLGYVVDFWDNIGIFIDLNVSIVRYFQSTDTLFGFISLTTGVVIRF